MFRLVEQNSLNEGINPFGMLGIDGGAVAGGACHFDPSQHPPGDFTNPEIFPGLFAYTFLCNTLYMED